MLRTGHSPRPSRNSWRRGPTHPQVCRPLRPHLLLRRRPRLRGPCLGRFRRSRPRPHLPLLSPGTKLFLWRIFLLLLLPLSHTNSSWHVWLVRWLLFPVVLRGLPPRALLSRRNRYLRRAPACQCLFQGSWTLPGLHILKFRCPGYACRCRLRATLLHLHLGLGPDGALP